MVQVNLKLYCFEWKTEGSQSFKGWGCFWRLMVSETQRKVKRTYKNLAGKTGGGLWGQRVTAVWVSCWDVPALREICSSSLCSLDVRAGPPSAPGQRGGGPPPSAAGRCWCSWREAEWSPAPGAPNDKEASMLEKINPEMSNQMGALVNLGHIHGKQMLLCWFVFASAAAADALSHH